MKKFRIGVLALMAAWFTFQAGAAEVDSASVTTFQPGTTLSSQEMNTSFGALISAINDNASRIAALEKAQAASTDVSGRQYCFHVATGGFFVASNSNSIGVARGSAAGGVTFNSDGTGMVTFYEDDYKEGFPSSAVIDQSSPLSSQGFTWTLTGHKLAITVAGDPVVHRFGVAKGGAVLLSGAASADPADNGSGIWYTVEQLVGIEVDDSNNCNGIFF